jgi:Na+/pantothenate symporter
MFQGGIKAVIWTDFLQGVVMVMSSIAVIVLGLIHVGGFLPVWERSREGGRIKIFECVFLRSRKITDKMTPSNFFDITQRRLAFS